MQEYFEIGKIANTHGLKGELKVVPLTDNPERYNDLKSIYIEKDNQLVEYNISGLKFFKGFVIIKLKEVDDIGTAESLKGLFIKIDRKNAIKLPRGSFFICDLMLCEIFDENGSLLGKMKDILKTGSNDVYTVQREDGKELLIPALKSVVKDISIENKRIVVSLPEGLLEDEI